MKRFNKLILTGAMVLAIGATTATAFADTASTTTGAVSLDELKQQRLELKKEILADRVADGVLTQTQSDEIIAQIEKNQAVCDGTGTARIGQSLGAGFGMKGEGAGLGNGQGAGLGNGQGAGLGNGNGNGNGNGSHGANCRLQ